MGKRSKSKQSRGNKVPRNSFLKQIQIILHSVVSDIRAAENQKDKTFPYTGFRQSFVKGGTRAISPTEVTESTYINFICKNKYAF